MEENTKTKKKFKKNKNTERKKKNTRAYQAVNKKLKDMNNNRDEAYQIFIFFLGNKGL